MLIDENILGHSNLAVNQESRGDSGYYKPEGLTAQEKKIIHMIDVQRAACEMITKPDSRW
jgi:hypothetical protein